MPILSTSPSVSTLPAATSRTWYLSEDEPELMTSTSMGPPKPWLLDGRLLRRVLAGGWRVFRAVVGAVDWAWMAVMATVFTMSSTVQPRERSLTGLRSPCRTGPTATAPEVCCTAL